MTIQFDDGIANAMLDAIETNIGASGVTMEIRSGAPPANCAAADSGVKLADIALPANFMADAAGRVKSKAGTWSDASADASGTAGHYRVKVGGACKIQGTCSGIGGGGDMVIDNPALVATQTFTVVTFDIVAPNP